MTEKASEMVTANGSPSGTATTTTVIEVMKALIMAEMLSLLKNGELVERLLMTSLPIKKRKVKVATATPNFPISLAIYSSLVWSGVASSSMLSLDSAFPDIELCPTPQMMALPAPSVTRDFPIKKALI